MTYSGRTPRSYPSIHRTREDPLQIDSTPRPTGALPSAVRWHEPVQRRVRPPARARSATATSSGPTIPNFASAATGVAGEPASREVDPSRVAQRLWTAFGPPLAHCRSAAIPATVVRICSAGERPPPTHCRGPVVVPSPTRAGRNSARRATLSRGRYPWGRTRRNTLPEIVR